LFRLGLLVIVGLCLSLKSIPCKHGFAQENDNPFDSASIQGSDDATVRALAKKPNFVREAILEKEVQEIEFDLGTVKTSCEYVIEVTVANKLATKVQFTEISTSCGCLSGFPKDLTIEKEKPLPLRVAFRVPREEESFGKVVSLVDRQSDVQLRITFKGVAKHAVQLSKRVFPVTHEGLTTFESDLEFPFADTKPDRLVFRFPTDSVLGWRVTTNGNRGKLIFDVSSDEEDISESAWISVTHRKEPGVICEIPIEIRRGFRPTARPSTILLRPLGQGRMGRVLLQYQGLSKPEERVDCQLKGLAKSKDKTMQFEFPIQALFIGASELLTVAELTVTDNRILEAPNDFELSVEFQSSVEDVPPFVVPMACVTGEK
jgi:hypothetical protein